MPRMPTSGSWLPASLLGVGAIVVVVSLGIVDNQSVGCGPDQEEPNEANAEPMTITVVRSGKAPGLTTQARLSYDEGLLKISTHEREDEMPALFANHVRATGESLVLGEGAGAITVTRQDLRTLVIDLHDGEATTVKLPASFPVEVPPEPGEPFRETPPLTLTVAAVGLFAIAVVRNLDYRVLATPHFARCKPQADEACGGNARVALHGNVTCFAICD